MSIVCGYRDDAGRVWLASDGRSTGGSFIYPEVSRKIWRGGGWLAGASGPDRIFEIMVAAAVGSETVEVLRDRLMAALKDGGWEPEAGRAGDPPAYSFSVLAARAGELWCIAPEGSIWRPTWGFAAIGSGQDFAYGAAHALRGHGISGDTIVRAAVSAAIEFRSDCGGEVVVESMGCPKAADSEGRLK